MARDKAVTIMNFVILRWHLSVTATLPLRFEDCLSILLPFSIIWEAPGLGFCLLCFMAGIELRGIHSGPSSAY
jgi:hypothetical protein